MQRQGMKAIWVLLAGVYLVFSAPARGLGDVRAWEGTITIPTYPWEDDVNPKFWALEGKGELSATATGSIVYPYTMQDHLSRTKVDRTYRALFLENEYLKVTCLPELGGRLHAVLDKTRGKDMFHRNQVIKPGMIAMRGAWISGGVEWNSGPHGHTVTILSPVDGVVGTNPDGSAFMEVSNLEQIFRTRWTVRVTLHPGRKYLDERIRIDNPTDGMHPYYFWNCTAFPNRPGTRFLYPMTLGTDHNAREFFHWPIHEGKDLSWLKNYVRYASIFAVNCQYDFFGAYDMDEDGGIVQVADHRVLPGKKAWTWGTWDFGLVSQQSLTDEDGPYIEVQSGPLPTQSDYGMLSPHARVAWQEWWYPVHGLGDGFEFATRDVAAQTDRSEGELTLKMIATAEFPRATCTLRRVGRRAATASGSRSGPGRPASAGRGRAVKRQVDLSPCRPRTVSWAGAGEGPVRVTIAAEDGRVLAAFTTPLPIPKQEPPERLRFLDKEDGELTVEETYLKGRWFDRSTNRKRAREYYEKALQADPGHVASLRALAVLDLESGLYREAMDRLERALRRDEDDGLAWYFLGVCHLALGQEQEAVDCGFRAVRPMATRRLGYDLAGRAWMRMGRRHRALGAFLKALRSDPADPRIADHRNLALYAAGRRDTAWERARQALRQRPTDPVPRALLALESDQALKRCAVQLREILGEDDFEMIETALVFADLGLLGEAERVLRAVCVDGVPEAERGPLPLYYLAYFASRRGDPQRARWYLEEAAANHRDRVFPSRSEALPVFRYAVEENPQDAYAHFHLGNLLGNLGRMDEAVACWQRAVQRNGSLSVAFRNLGLAAWVWDEDAGKAVGWYRRAIAARPADQTLYRDLAEILIATDRRGEAIDLMESMPLTGQRRSDITILLAQAYLDEKRYTDAIELLESTPYFVNWEGQDVTWVLHYRAHVARGEERLQRGELRGALEDFRAALTYPENLGVGRSDKPQEAAAEYGLGRTLEALGRIDEARAAFQRGAAGAPGSEQQEEYRKRCQEALDSLPQPGGDQAQGDRR